MTIHKTVQDPFFSKGKNAGASPLQFWTNPLTRIRIFFIGLNIPFFLPLGTGHNLAGGVGRWKQWGGGGHIFFSQEKGGFIKY